jgi:hypothetical protein
MRLGDGTASEYKRCGTAQFLNIHFICFHFSVSFLLLFDLASPCLHYAFHSYFILFPDYY